MNIKGTGLELTPEIRDYAEKKIMSLDKFIRTDRDNIFSEVELSHVTKHHKNGDIFKAEINIGFSGLKFRAVAEGEGLYSSIDAAREIMEHELVSHKDRGTTLFRRGARSVKKMLKGIAKRNPFTSKYDK